eukprot:scaffold11656_cov163-Amphora_coffeaeformis.AAC.1
MVVAVVVVVAALFIIIRLAQYGFHVLGTLLIAQFQKFQQSRQGVLRVLDGIVSYHALRYRTDFNGKIVCGTTTQIGTKGAGWQRFDQDVDPGLRTLLAHL